MNEWMDGWMHGWMDDGWMDGWINVFIASSSVYCVVFLGSTLSSYSASLHPKV